jgi:hypothetical protein
MTGTVTSRPPGAAASGSAVTPKVETRLLPAECRTGTLPKAARDLVAEHLPPRGLASFVQDAPAVAGELVTSAVQHAPHGAVGFALKYADGVLRLEVEDGSPDNLLPRQPGSTKSAGGAGAVPLRHMGIPQERPQHEDDLVRVSCPVDGRRQRLTGCHGGMRRQVPGGLAQRGKARTGLSVPFA